MGKGSRLKQQRRTNRKQRADRGVVERRTAPPPLERITSTDGVNPVAELRSMLLDRGWVEQPPDGVLAQMWFEYPATLINFAPTGPADPDGIHPATMLVCARSVDDEGYLRDFEIHVELAGRDPGAGACPEHAAPADLNFPLDTAGLADLANALDTIEQHVANWQDMIACADGAGPCP